MGNEEKMEQDYTVQRLNVKYISVTTEESLIPVDFNGRKLHGR
jgi:hypothetical protein